ncbi:MAG: polyprenyl synthetase family protein [Sulfuricurvum sp.]|jgi:octaprenyl-diphosphate synthase|uniref:polyprenyl synthetase family protein n=1 Tax=Sulfuricurvum sp. TaxID=2025608 RepID=UPI0025EFB5F5|nr:polyprenyl synthetase family protein [Sulfuricurvum sp.]MCK9372394.1 polyprenyl synthetase family protein [Sulfuricurvum sp.]
MLERVETIISQLVDEVGYVRSNEFYAKLAGGKRLRARLILAIAPNEPEAPRLGAIVELIHAASLLHDDVIDESTLRRGVPSINATHGSKMAIMMGDILYSKAFSALTGFDSKIARSIAESVTNLSVGEMMDVELAEAFNTDRQRYEKMLYLKTATLIEACAYSAALLAGKNGDAHALYGKNLGLAFQIVDDILDITADEATLGKPSLNDFSEGKTTLPYIDLYEALPSQDRQLLISYHGKILNDEQKKWIRTKMDEFEIISASYAYARRVCDEALDAIGEDPSLRAIIETVIQRSH